MKKIATLLIIIFTTFFSANAQSLDLLNTKDLSSIRVDYLSDTDIIKIQQQLDTNNLTIEQLESTAMSRGMSAIEFNKLKSRLNALPRNNRSDNRNNVKNNKQGIEAEKSDKPKYNESVSQQNKKIKDTVNALVFGSELFDNPTLNFEPNSQLATPVNYILGPGDDLQISVYGTQEFNDNMQVSPEGKLNIQYVGQISVAGMTIEAATQKITNALARVYTTIGSGQSKVSITLSNIRTIKVTIIGSKQPGNYSVSSLSTVYNALHLAGGPSKNGSYRNIELIRNNKIIKNIDIYRFLVAGDQSDNIGLKDNDVIRIPAYSQRVTVEGEVKRPGIFELKKGETFTELLTFASGFTESAYTASVHVVQKTNKEFKVKDITAADYATYKPMAGDVFRVSKILNRFENRIKIEGAVFRPNIYSFTEGMRISDLIKQAEGLKEDAYTKRAMIVRLKEDLTPQLVTVNLDEAMSGNTDANILLNREDVVTVYSILDFREEYTITIDGEVKSPGQYTYFEGLTLNDIFIQAGGLTGSASKRVEIARMIKAESVNNASASRISLFNIEINSTNNEQVNNFKLMPFDVINVRRMAVYEKPETVIITGAVAYSGRYALANRKDRVSDIIERAGGLTQVADINGIKIKRPILSKQIEDLENVNVSLDKNDTITTKLSKKLKEEVKHATIPIDWRAVAKNKNHYSNVVLFPGDEIEVSVFNEAVKVTGNVLLTSEIPYREGRGFAYYLDAVGGVNSKGWKRKAYVIYPNGSAAVTSNFMFFRTYPKVLPGSQIVVPEKPERKRLSTGEFVSIASVLASLAGVIIAIITIKP